MADAAAALALRAARPDGAAPSVRAASTPEVPVAGPTPAGPTPPGSAASEPADPVRSTADGRDGADRLLDPAHHLARGIDLLAAGDFAEALTALRTAVALGDGSPVTVLNLAIAEDRAGDVARARAQMRRLAASRPDWDEPVLRLAESLRAGGDMAAAEAAYREVLDRNPRREEALVALSGLLIARGAAEEARVLLLRCCGVNPANAEAWDTLGLALLATEAASLALASFVTAQRLAPDVLDYALHAVEAASLAGELEAELARLEVAVQESPLDAALHTARGVALARLGQRAAAIDAFEVAVALAPEAAMPVALLGGVLAHANRLREAEDALRRAADRDPGNPRLRNDLAAVLMRMHRHAEAREILSALRSEHGDSVPVLCNLANATACVGLQAEAVALAEAAVRLDPEAVLPRRTLCNTLPYAEGVDGTRLLAALRACSARLPRESLPPFHNVPDPERRLVVGLLSGTLRSHPVGWLTVAAFEMLPPAAFELVCLVQNGAAGDPLAQRFRAVAGRWIDIDLLDDVALARCAREQGIDVLIDLGGYGDAGRMPACAHRLAPVQIKWVGMQNHSSGLAEMDWLLTARWEAPAGFEPFYAERLLRLPDGYVCYSPPPYAPDLVPLPALARGHVTFGCFNNLAKVTPATIAAWAEILSALPAARLILKTHQFADEATAARLRAAFVALGVDADRLDLRGGSGHRAFLREYNDVDIALDPFPYSGGLTTCEALWMGVPTVALAGEIFASRHSVSHLCNAGLDDWVAGSREAYVALAIAKARDVAALAALRSGLRDRVRASPLCDAPRFGRGFAAALRQAWATWCAQHAAGGSSQPAS